MGQCTLHELNFVAKQDYREIAIATGFQTFIYIYIVSERSAVHHVGSRRPFEAIFATRKYWPDLLSGEVSLAALRDEAKTIESKTKASEE